MRGVKVRILQTTLGLRVLVLLVLLPVLLPLLVLMLFVPVLLRLLFLVPCVCALRSKPVMRRLPIDATWGRCVERTWGVLCGVLWRCLTPQSPEAKSRLISLLTIRVCSDTKCTQSTCVSLLHAVVDKAHGGVIDVASAPC